MRTRGWDKNHLMVGLGHGGRLKASSRITDRDFGLFRGPAGQPIDAAEADRIAQHLVIG